MKYNFAFLFFIYFCCIPPSYNQSYEQSATTIKKALGNGAIASVSISGSQIEYIAFREKGCFDRFFASKFDVRNIDVAGMEFSELFQDEKRGHISQVSVSTKANAGGSIKTLDYIFSQADYSFENGNAYHFIPGDNPPESNLANTFMYLYYTGELGVSQEEFKQALIAIQQMQQYPDAPLINIHQEGNELKKAVNTTSSNKKIAIEYLQNIGALMIWEKTLQAGQVTKTNRTFIPLYTIDIEQTTINKALNADFQIEFKTKSDLNAIIQTSYSGDQIGDSFNGQKYSRHTSFVIETKMFSESQAGQVKAALGRLVLHGEETFSKIHRFEGASKKVGVGFLSEALEIRDYLSSISRQTKINNGCQLELLRIQGAKQAMQRTEILRIDLSRVGTISLDFNSDLQQISLRCKDGEECAYEGKESYMRGRPGRSSGYPQDRISLDFDYGYMDVGLLNAALLSLANECQKDR